jgi:hypothetical protein
MGEMQEVTDAVMYLEKAAFVTGEILHVDGGWSAGYPAPRAARSFPTLSKGLSPLATQPRARPPSGASSAGNSTP